MGDLSESPHQARIHHNSRRASNNFSSFSSSKNMFLEGFKVRQQPSLQALQPTSPNISF